MERYLIESSHTAEDCKKVVKDFHAAGYLHQFEWGCDEGVHTAWAIVEAMSPEHARQMVPWLLRDKSRIVRVVKYQIADKTHPAKGASEAPRE